MKLLFKEKIKLYANSVYLQKIGEPKNTNDLSNHTIISYSNSNHLHDHEQWRYTNKNKSIILIPKFNSNDIESSLIACSSGYGIGRFTDLNVKILLQKKLIQPILKEYDSGKYQLVAVYTSKSIN